MAKYRMCGGLAMMSGHDIGMLANMSAQGWHVSGLTCGFLYRFEQGSPHAYDYAVDFQRDFTPEAQEIFRMGGWQPVLVAPGWQILRAESGTVPLYTNDESKEETLSRSRASMGKTALVCFVAALLFAALESWFSAQGNELGSSAFLILLVAAAAGFVCSFMPFLGYTRTLRKIQTAQDEDPCR